MAFKIALTIVKIILNSIAHPKPETSKPGTNLPTNNTIKALITKVKRPSVKILIGKVKIIKIGLITAFTNPKTTAANKAAPKPVNFTPGIKKAAIVTATVLISQLIIIFIYFFQFINNHACLNHTKI